MSDGQKRVTLNFAGGPQDLKYGVRYPDSMVLYQEIEFHTSTLLSCELVGTTNSARSTGELAVAKRSLCWEALNTGDRVSFHVFTVLCCAGKLPCIYLWYQCAKGSDAAREFKVCCRPGCFIESDCAARQSLRGTWGAGFADICAEGSGSCSCA